MPFSLSYVAEYLQNHLSKPYCTKCGIYIHDLRVGIIANSTIQITGYCRLCGKYYALVLPQTYRCLIRDSEDMKYVCDCTQKCMLTAFSTTDKSVEKKTENKPYGHIE
jgi:hypothetical protein